MHNWKKNVAIFISSQSISILGSSLVQFAIAWHITLTTKSGFAQMIIILCTFLPMLLLSPFAGVWADRYNRKTLIMVADGSIALCTLTLAAVFSMGYEANWLFYLAAGVRSLGSAIQGPCVGAMIPDIVPEDSLTRVNGINSSFQSAIYLVSPMLGGALFTLVPIEKIFMIDVITAIIAILIMLLFLKLPVKEKNNTQSNKKLDYLADLKLGFNYIEKNLYLKHFFLFNAIFCFMAAPVAFLTPLQAIRTFGAEVWRLTTLEIVFSIGTLVGGLIMVAWGGFKNKTHTIVLSGLIMGLSTIFMGLPFSFWIYMSFMLVCGISLSMFNTPASVILQENVDSEYMGRVYSVMTMINSSFMPIGMLLFGPMADITKIEYILIVTGMIILISSVMLLASKPLLAVGIKEKIYINTED